MYIPLRYHFVIFFLNRKYIRKILVFRQITRKTDFATRIRTHKWMWDATVVTTVTHSNTARWTDVDDMALKKEVGNGVIQTAQE